MHIFLDIPQTYSDLLFVGLALMFGLTVTLIGYINKKTDERITAVEKDAKEIKQNYLDRFDEVKSIISKNHVEIVERIGELRVAIAKTTQS